MAMKTKTAKKSKATPKPKSAPVGADVGRAFSIAINKRKTVQERVAALARAPLAVCENDDNLQAILGVLRDVNEPIEVRMAAMQSLLLPRVAVLHASRAQPHYGQG